MLGDVVKLFLCRSCKGLFVLDCQVEKHAENCNGDAFKSPANLFACEREHFLELLTPSAADDKSQVSKQNVRKRRKTSPRANYATENDVGSHSSSRKKDADIFPSRRFSETEAAKFWEPQQNFRTVSQHSCSQTKPLVRSLEGSTVLYPQGEAMLHVFHPSQNSFGQNVSFGVTATQTSFVTDNILTRKCAESCSSLGELDTSYFSDVIEERRRKRSCSESDIQTVHKSSTCTPATNLLAYLSTLQQGEEELGSQPDEQQDQSVSLEHSPFSTAEESSFYITENQPEDETDPLETCAILQDSVCLEKNTETNPQHEQIHIVGQSLIQHGDFQFRPVATVGELQDTSGLLPQAKLKPCMTESEVSPTYLENVHPVTGEDGGIGDAQVVYHTETTEASVNVKLLPDIADVNLTPLQEIENHVVGAENVELIETGLGNLDESSAIFSVDIPEYAVDTHSEASHTQEQSCIQGPVVYILEPSGLLRTVAIESVTDGTGEISANCTLSDAVDSNIQNTIELNNTLILDTNSDLSDLKDLSVESEQSGMTPTSSFLKSDKVVSKGKTKSQIRLEELNALRDEVLLQANEILPDENSKKTCYSCNVCGHIAKSVKFMHNHLQMHSDGKVFYECDQCDFKSRQRHKLLDHQQRHSRSRLLCHLCPATFMDLVSLNRHVTAKHTGVQHLKCDQCDFCACHADDLKEHKLKHTGELLCCNVEGCGYKTPYQRALRVHQKRHFGEKNYKCSMCNYETVNKSTLARHMKSHTQERPFQCSSCDFRANTKYGVMFHMQHMHQQQKSYYMCDKCPFRTAYASSLTKHLQTHLGGFTCPLCKHTSGTVANVKKHVQQVHHLDNIEVVDRQPKINVKNYLRTEADKPTMEPLLPSAMNVDSQDLPPLVMTDMERQRIDPMKLSFHFHDLAQGPFMSSGSGTNLTRSSSIPDLFTFSGMNRSNSQSDLFTFSGISTMTRSNSMSDLVSFANSMCADGGEHVNMDVSLSDASVPPSMDVSGLSLGDGTEVSLNEGPGSPGCVALALQCSKCLGLLMNDVDVDAHSKVCTGSVQMV
ncbi:uncharacterized protein [Littorina saxatilis]|uniref:C2H2-type domain-containing protein n=1 Tax=Littorina saxatilis TaxID=31220 RepID=A0AAN9GPU1_9CAEN